ncbi:hypothetical protein ACFY00_24165 [Kitasatospora sp. NPDC001540]|uniref:hypothetical protein n=1 Tax=Kitasatospora sp. NPDC001540 TaxID=3364014 RepID=UPI0036BDC691
MKDAMWVVVRTSGVRYRGPKDPDQQALDLEFEPDTGPLRRILLDHLASAPAGRTVDQLKTYALPETVCRPTQVIPLLKRMRDGQEIDASPGRIIGASAITAVRREGLFRPARAQQPSLWRMRAIPGQSPATRGSIETMSGSKKYSISLPENLAETVRAHVGPGGFSAYVAEALEQRVAMDKLREIVADFETDNDELTRAEIEAARALLRHDHRQAGGAAA